MLTVKVMLPIVVGTVLTGVSDTAVVCVPVPVTLVVNAMWKIIGDSELLLPVLVSVNTSFRSNEVSNLSEIFGPRYAGFGRMVNLAAVVSVDQPSGPFSGSLFTVI